MVNAVQAEQLHTTYVWACGATAQWSLRVQIGLPGAGRPHWKCLNLRHLHTLLVRGGGGLLAPFMGTGLHTYFFLPCFKGKPRENQREATQKRHALRSSVFFFCPSCCSSCSNNANNKKIHTTYNNNNTTTSTREELQPRTPPQHPNPTTIDHHHHHF